jgi:multicomponent Na+:H+ antiporter subunit D
VSLAVSVLTLFSMSKIWNGAFWGDVELVVQPSDPVSQRYGGTFPMLASTAVLVGVSIALAVVAGPLYALCERASADLLHPSAYVKAVLG